MSWSIEEHIGECRPFPAQVVVYKGETGERMTYVPERTCHKHHRADGYDFCSECGHNITGGWATFCPGCGARVEQGQGRLDI